MISIFCKLGPATEFTRKVFVYDKSVVQRLTVFLAINSKGKKWDGLGWSTQGKPFLSRPSVVRSLHEQGEDVDQTLILSAELVGSENDTAP
jgi:hypothetical protein